MRSTLIFTFATSVNSGTCKFSLAKHTAPVDNLRLDLTGARCLSWDSEGRDRSVCLWDLTNGMPLVLINACLRNVKQDLILSAYWR